MNITELEAINGTIERCTASVSRMGIMFSFHHPERVHSSTMIMCKFDDSGNVNVEDLLQARLNGAKASIQFRQSND